MPDIDWAFQKNEDGSSQGWNDPSIAEFKSNRLENLTREIIQNSLDAASDDGAAVCVEFVLEKYKQDAIPGIATLKGVMELCSQQRQNQNPDMFKEFDVAYDVAKASDIYVLSVSDYHTKGMPGPCEDGKPFYQYLKTVGQSGGDSHRAGSHGIGKAAPLACSDLRTIFVSTVWKENGKKIGLVQGRSVLMSFKRDGYIHKSTGYWGNLEGYQPISPEQVPEPYSWMVREDVGTTVHIIGFSAMVRTDWELMVIGYAVSNYFAAFKRGRLSIKVGKYEVNKENIGEMSLNARIFSAMNRKKTHEKLEDARHYMRCIDPESDENTITEVFSVKELGSTSITMNFAEGAPKKIALIRNNMLITDWVPGFWKNVPKRFLDFSAVVEVVNDKGAQFIRLMEPPSHNSLGVDWLPSEAYQAKGEKALDDLSRKLKDFVERHASGKDVEFGKVDFMADFFADEAGDDRGDSNAEDEIDPNGNFKFMPKPVRQRKDVRIKLESEADQEMDGVPDQGAIMDEGGAGRRGGGGTIENPGRGPNPGDGAGGPDRQSDSASDLDRPVAPVRLGQVRIVKLNAADVNFFFTATGSGKILIRIHEAGSDYDDPFDVSSSTAGMLSNGAIELDVVAGKRVNVSATLSRSIVGGLKIVASYAPAPQAGAA